MWFYKAYMSENAKGCDTICEHKCSTEDLKTSIKSVTTDDG